MTRTAEASPSRLKALVFANPASVHTQKWVRGLHSRGIDVLLFGLQDSGGPPIEGVRVVTAGVPKWAVELGEGSIGKLAYLKAVPRLRALAAEFQPDIVHAHYVSSYGLAAALAGVRPLLISVWGSDIYDFPEHSRLHRQAVRHALSRADAISSTSHVMARQTSRFTDSDVTVVPFGVDIARFRPGREPNPFGEGHMVIGTVKTLHPKYGIGNLVEAFAILRRRRPNMPLKLLIVGGGSQEAELKYLARDRGVADDVLFTGLVSAEEVPRYHRMLDVYVALSELDSESFGVAIVEASASGRPVVVNDVGGLSEVVDDGVTGVVVKRGDTPGAADALEALVGDAELRRHLGEAGRRRVERLYDFDANLDQMIALYRETLGCRGQ